MLIIIGLVMMYSFPEVSNPPFMSGLAFFIIGLYLALDGIYGREFSGCIFSKQVELPKKKGFFS
ncbi:hypothetical protein GW846_02740 [Candidatus Gracilibacteria bacterium]|nr:hypothetical protein [Candidatus Gracilibacteria bacterium]